MHMVDENNKSEVTLYSSLDRLQSETHATARLQLKRHDCVTFSGYEFRTEKHTVWL